MSWRGVSLLLLVIGVGALAAALLSGGMAAQQRRADNEALYSHTLEVLAAGRELLSSAQDIETGHRGFLLARDDRYLEPWTRADAVIDDHVERLRTLTDDNPLQQQHIATISELIRELRGGVSASLALAHEGRFEEAIDVFRLDAGKQLMDDVRLVSAQIRAEEERLLVERRDAATASARIYAGYLGGLLLLGIGLILFAIYSALSAAAQTIRADLQAERAAAAQAQAANDRRFRTMTDALPQIVFAATPDGRFDFINARWREFTGGPGDQNVWTDHLHPDDREVVAAEWARSLETGDPFEREVRLRRADGAYRWFLHRTVPLRNADGEIEGWLGAGADVHEVRVNMEARDLISQELNHRIKNIFSVIISLITLSSRASPEQGAFARSLRDRIMALARAHEFVRPQDGESVSGSRPRTFAAFIEALLQPYQDQTGGRIRVTGDDFSFGEKSATALALFFHEMGTNAAKYGALSVNDGVVEVSVHRQDGSVVIIWSERGGPQPTAPSDREGFGGTLARLSIEGQLNGSQMREWTPEGLRATIRIPEESLG